MPIKINKKLKFFIQFGRSIFTINSFLIYTEQQN